ncbi:Protein of unknown function [Leuconostoc citreum]|nr:Protein of unknown function [Leuconostoc citreum LBAE C10]CCF26624.1 Protein of unknown function [Leuconostoc citreum LBAE C11]CCF29373.1 Protein of unknown function [Leuconostoc citreum LBAE E16]CDX65556.1 Protein of unknown function [Leuconostoc citreum]CDX67325.1 Protein of unknown function [Leuconostoc citreum]
MDGTKTVLRQSPSPT